MEIIEFNIGGVFYSTTLTTLKQVPDNLLLKLALNSLNSNNCVNVVKRENRIFIDRDGNLFTHILNYLRNPQSWAPPENVDKGQLAIEANYYVLLDLIHKLKDKPKPKEIKYNVSFIRFTSKYDRDNLPIYHFKFSGVKGPPDTKDVTKSQLIPTINEYIKYLNELGYKLVTIGETKIPETKTYYFEAY